MPLRCLFLVLCLVGWLCLPSNAYAFTDLDSCDTAYGGNFQPWDYTAKIVFCFRNIIEEGTMQMLGVISAVMVRVTGALFTLAVMVFGIRIMGGQNEAAAHTVGFLVRMGIVLLFSFGLGGLAGVMFDILDRLTMLGAGGFDPWGTIDYFMGKLLGFGFGLVVSQGVLGIIGSILFSDPIGFTVFMAGIMAIINLMLFILDILYVYLMAVMSVGFMLILSPIVVPLGIFFFTERYVRKWTDMLISALITPMLLFAALSFFLTIINAQVMTVISILCGPANCSDINSPDFRALWRLNVPVFSWVMPADRNYTDTIGSAAQTQGTVVPSVQVAINPLLQRGGNASILNVPGVEFGPDTMKVIKNLLIALVILIVYVSMLKSLVKKMPELASNIASAASGVRFETQSLQQRVNNIVSGIKWGGAAAIPSLAAYTATKFATRSRPAMGSAVAGASVRVGTRPAVAVAAAGAVANAAFTSTVAAATNPQRKKDKEQLAKQQAALQEAREAAAASTEAVAGKRGWVDEGLGRFGSSASAGIPATNASAGPPSAFKRVGSIFASANAGFTAVDAAKAGAAMVQSGLLATASAGFEKASARFHKADAGFNTSAAEIARRMGNAGFGEADIKTVGKILGDAGFTRASAGFNQSIADIARRMGDAGFGDASIKAASKILGDAGFGQSISDVAKRMGDAGFIRASIDAVSKMMGDAKFAEANAGFGQSISEVARRMGNAGFSKASIEAVTKMLGDARFADANAGFGQSISEIAKRMGNAGFSEASIEAVSKMLGDANFAKANAGFGQSISEVAKRMGDVGFSLASIETASKILGDAGFSKANAGFGADISQVAKRLGDAGFSEASIDRVTKFMGDAKFAEASAGFGTSIQDVAKRMGDAGFSEVDINTVAKFAGDAGFSLANAGFMSHSAWPGFGPETSKEPESLPVHRLVTVMTPEGLVQGTIVSKAVTGGGAMYDVRLQDGKVLQRVQSDHIIT